MGCTRANEVECQEIVERYVWLRNGKPLRDLPELADAARGAVKKCSREVSKSAYSCAKQSQTGDQWETCLE